MAIAARRAADDASSGSSEEVLAKLSAGVGVPLPAPPPPPLPRAASAPEDSDAVRFRFAGDVAAVAAEEARGAALSKSPLEAGAAAAFAWLALGARAASPGFGIAFFDARGCGDWSALARQALLATA